MDEIGVFTPEQARQLWQFYLSSQQAAAVQKRQPVETSPHRVFVKNTESEVIPPYACMRVTGVDVVGGQTVVTVEKPSSTEGEFLFNSQFEIPVVDTENDVFGVGWAYRYGIVIMLGDAPSTPSTQYIPIVDSWEIEEGSGPFVVYGSHNVTTRGLIGRFNSVGVSEKYVRLDADLAPATAGAALTSPSTAVASVYEINGSDDLVDTGDNIDIYNYFEHIEVLAGTLAVASFTSGKWRLTSADCEPLT